MMIKKPFSTCSPHNTIPIISPTKIFKFRSIPCNRHKNKSAVADKKNWLVPNNNNMKNDEWNSNQNKSWRDGHFLISLTYTYAFCNLVSHSTQC